MNTFFHLLFNKGVTSELSLSENRTTRFVNFALIYGSAFCLLSTIINLIFMGWLEGLVPAVFFLFFGMGFYYQERQKIKITKLFITTISIIGVILSCWLFGLKGYPYYLFLLTFSMSMVFYPQRQQQINLLLLHLLCLGLSLGLAPFIKPLMEIPFPFVFGVMTFLFVIVLFYFVIHTYTQENEIFEQKTNQLVASLENQKTQIEQQSQALLIFNRRLQEEIEAKNLVQAQLEDSNEHLKRFVYVASHDLKEPLRTIGSFTQLLERELSNDLSEDRKVYLDFITGGVKRMGILLEDLLAYSKIDNNTKLAIETIDLNDLLEQLKNNLTNLLERNQGTILIKKTLPTIQGCPTQINQLFQNIISNALKFKGTHPPVVKISYSENDQHYTFAIEDNGIGIPATQLSKIFTAFQRVDKNKYEGSGIGLAICEKVLKNHQGKIWVTSELGKGTIFYFSIPKQLA